MLSMQITNFRGYKGTTNITFDDLTVFVGKNDIGKSTIPEALDIFFNDGKGVTKIDKGDVNKAALAEDNTETVIPVCFTDLPANIVIDDTYSTTLANEYMLNQDGCLVVVKKYKNGGAAKIYIQAKHPTNPACADLLLKKNAELKSIIQTHNIDCEDRRTNAVMRAAIWGHFVEDLQFQEKEIDVSKEDAKKVWDKLSAYLPVYALFQADRKNSDGDDEVQDPLKKAVQQILMNEELQVTLARVADEVKTKLNEVAERTLTKLREMSPDVANSLNPVIPSFESLKWADVFKNVSITGDDDVPVNKRGSGVRRLILLNFFRAEAERRLEESDGTHIIYAIEEPETSQHTENQKLLTHAFLTLSCAPNTQVILTTHSATIVKQLNYDNLRMVTMDGNGNRRLQKVDQGILHYPSLNEVNYTAFNEVSEEYHDELYAFLEFHHWLTDYAVGRTLLPYIKIKRDGTTSNENYFLAMYIRHQIHHPENQFNARYTQVQLGQSIEDMRNYIRTRAEQEGLWPPMIS